MRLDVFGAVRSRDIPNLNLVSKDTWDLVNPGQPLNSPQAPKEHLHTLARIGVVFCFSEISQSNKYWIPRMVP